MAREAAGAVTRFTVRRQFVDGDTVCSIIDWEMALPGVGRMKMARLGPEAAVPPSPVQSAAGRLLLARRARKSRSASVGASDVARS
jgi:hypothetical protein